MKWVRGLFFGLIGCLPSSHGLSASGPALPVLFQSGLGRFEVAAVDGPGAQRVVAMATEAWQFLAAPLALPDSFNSPVFVRLLPVDEWQEAAPFRVFVEAGGIVSVRVRWDKKTSEMILRRALVQGLIMRQAVARHGINDRLSAPLWLEHACVGWWRTRSEPAQLDGLRQRTLGRVAPAMISLLNWRRGEAEPLEFSEGAVWLLSFLRHESSRSQEWLTFLQRVLGGDAPETALLAAYPERFENARERELWWLTGWHALSRARTLPGLEPWESRRVIEELTRLVWQISENDKVLSFRDVLHRRTEPLVDEEFKVRNAALNRLLPSLHPFYRNAAISLGGLFAARDGSAAGPASLWTSYQIDWRDAQELESGSTAALDALERTIVLSKD